MVQFSWTRLTVSPINMGQRPIPNSGERFSTAKAIRRVFSVDQWLDSRNMFTSCHHASGWTLFWAPWISQCSSGQTISNPFKSSSNHHQTIIKSLIASKVTRCRRSCRTSRKPHLFVLPGSRYSRYGSSGMWLRETSVGFDLHFTWDPNILWVEVIPSW
jgi:hypothetical protein